MKSEGALQHRMRELTRHVLLALMAVIAVVSIWTPLGWQFVAERWFTLPNFFWFLPVPVLVAVSQPVDLAADAQSRQPCPSVPADAGPDLPRL